MYRVSLGDRPASVWPVGHQTKHCCSSRLLILRRLRSHPDPLLHGSPFQEVLNISVFVNLILEAYIGSRLVVIHAERVKASSFRKPEVLSRCGERQALLWSSIRRGRKESKR